MFDRLIQLSLENRLIVLAAALLLLIAGVIVAVRRHLHHLGGI